MTPDKFIDPRTTPRDLWTGEESLVKPEGDARALRAAYLSHLFANAASVRAIGRVIRTLAEPLLRRRRRNVTYRALMALDDRTLDDIGLRRADIRALAEARSRLPEGSLARRPAEILAATTAAKRDETPRLAA